MLLNFIRSGDPGPFGRDAFRRALGFPCCWPADKGLAEQALALGYRPPSVAPAIGEIYVVAVSDTSDQAELWRLTPTAEQKTAVGPIVAGTASESAALAQRVITRDLPFIAELGAVARALTWSPSLIMIQGRTPVASDLLTGRSFGLSFCLGVASLALALAVPHDLLATAEVESDGTVVAVGGLEAKVRIIASCALGVTRLMVASSQAGEARRLAEEAGRPDLRVIPVTTLREALGEVFPPDRMEAQVRLRCRDAESARVFAESLHRAALESHQPGILDWSMIENSAGIVESALQDASGPEDRRARTWARRARLIARRHRGLPALLDFPDDAELAVHSRNVRIRILAHVVQSAADSDDEHAVAYTDKARAFLRPEGDRSREDFELLGAMGRAFGSAGRYEEAADVLRQAVTGWMDAQLEFEASFSLCEWLRTLGLLGRTSEVRDVLAGWLARVEGHPRINSSSIGFARVAAARALVQAGAPREAVVYVDDPGIDWDSLRDDIRASRLRWLARALAESGEESRAQATVRAIPHDSDQEVLAAMDTELRKGSDAGPWLRVLEAREDARDDVARLRARAVARPELTQPGGICRFVAEHYRY